MCKWWNHPCLAQCGAPWRDLRGEHSLGAEGSRESARHSIQRDQNSVPYLCRASLAAGATVRFEALHLLSRFAKLRPSLLRLDFNRRPIRHCVPDFVDLFVRDSNAPIGPILQPVRRPDRSVSVRQTMHEHVSSRRDALSPRRCTFALIGIGNVNGLVELAVRVAKIKNVGSLGSFVVPLPRLWPDRVASQRDLIRLN